MEQIMALLPGDKRSTLLKIKQFRDDMISGKHEITLLGGKKFPPGFNAQTADYVKNNWQGIRENDVFLVSFPKTGTNWCLTVLLKIITHNDEKLKQMYENLPMPLFGLEMGPAEKFAVVDSLPISRRLFVSHIDGEDFPVEKATKKGAKIIYVLRNPKDQTVSWYHFSSKLPGLQKYKDDFPDDWKKFTEKYFEGKHPMCLNEGDWYPEHILSWHKYKHQANVKFVYYEDMKKDLSHQVQAMAEFLDIELNKEEANAIAEECGFEAMKREAENNKEVEVHEARRKFNLLRKGGVAGGPMFNWQVGGWKDYFTVSQSAAIDEEFKQKLANTDIRFTYEL